MPDDPCTQSQTVTAVTASQLSERVRRRAAEAEERRLEIERLYDLVQAMMLGGNARRSGDAKGANKYFNGFNSWPFLGERAQKHFRWRMGVECVGRWHRVQVLPGGCF